MTWDAVFRQSEEILMFLGALSAAVVGAVVGDFPLQLSPISYADVASGARTMLRRAREANAAGESGWRRLSVELPYLPPGLELDAPLQPDDLALWPGGQQQRHRDGLRPMAEAMLTGYDASFVGLIDVGMGVWTFGDGDATAVSHPSDLTFNEFERLCSGKFGDGPTRADHTILLINQRFSGNPSKTGQPWERGLRRKAASCLAEGWSRVYGCRPIGDGGGVRGSGGAYVGAVLSSESWGAALCTPSGQCLETTQQWDAYEGRGGGARACARLQGKTLTRKYPSAPSAPW